MSFEFDEKESKKYSLLAEVACDYYERKLGQNEIAERLHLSRSRVSRLLKEAEEQGIVSITINYRFERHFELEERLTDLFPRVTFVVLNNRDREKEIIQSDVAKLASGHIHDLLKKDMVVGTSWGATLSETISFMKRSPVRVQIVQLMGTAASQYPAQTPQGIVYQLSSAWGQLGNFLNLPLYIEEEHVREVMCNDPYNRQVLNQGLFSDLILTGISDIGSIGRQPLWRSYLTRELLTEACSKGAVGALLAWFYDRDGNEVDCSWNRRCVCMPFHNIKNVPNVVVIASGKQKASAVGTALRAGLIDTLITDGTTASSILGLTK